jgi:hypothetical protein
MTPIGTQDTPTNQTFEPSLSGRPDGSSLMHAEGPSILLLLLVADGPRLRACFSPRSSPVRIHNFFWLPKCSLQRYLVGVQELLRLGVLMLLNIHLHAWYGHPEWIPHPVPQDRAFRDVWWVAMGW